MEETTGFQNWELLQSSNAAPFSSPYPADNPTVSEAIDGDSEDGAITHDYFALDSDKRHPIRAPSEEESGIDSDNPSWVDPDSDSRYADRPRGQMGFAGTGGFWSDESSDGQRSVADTENSELSNFGDAITEVGLEGIESRHLNSGGYGAAIGGSEGVETGQEKHDELGAVEFVKTREGSDSSAHMSTGSYGSNNPSPGEGEKGRMVWWKTPFELLKFCDFRVRPIWSISIAAAFVGVVMLGRRLYNMKHKSRSIPLKIAIDDKKVYQLMVRAARLNEAFSVARRVPIVRPALTAGGGATPWPVASLR